ncbi:MAG TPA: PEP-CTERM sorting domain-containing protein [Tepidisphaeraceae bacterium]
MSKKMLSRRSLPFGPVAMAAAAVLMALPSAQAANKALNTDAVGPTANFTDPIFSINTVGTAGGTSPVATTDALFFNTSGVTTLNNDLTNASFAGFTFNADAIPYTIGGNAFTLTGGITNSSTSTQTFNNVITLSDTTHTFTTTGDLLLNNSLVVSTAFAPPSGQGANGTLEFRGPGTTTLGGTNNYTFRNGRGLSVGTNNGVGGNVNITGASSFGAGATLNNFSGGLQVSSSSAANSSIVKVTGSGSLNLFGNPTTGAPGNTGIIVGQNSLGGTSTLQVDDGSLTIGGDFNLIAFGNNAATATGLLNVNGGTATIAAAGTTANATQVVALGRDLGTGIVNLNGGTLQTARFFARDTSTGQGGATGGTANFNFNGGTLRLLANQADLLQSATAGNNLALTSVTTGATSGNLSTLDANGFNVGINNAITGLGGFNINSSSANSDGVVTFGGTGAKTYAGATNLQDSTLSIAFTDALTGASGTGGVNVSGGTLTSTVAAAGLGGDLNVSGGTVSANGDAAVGAFTLAGAKNFALSGGTLRTNLASTSSFDQIFGTGAFNVTGGTLDLLNFVPDYAAMYDLLEGFASGSVANLAIVNYDTANYTASLNNEGVLSFTEVPEPSALTLLGLAGLGLLRRSRAASR